MLSTTGFISQLNHGLSLPYWQTLLNTLRNEFNCCFRIFIMFSIKVTNCGDAADVSIEIPFVQNRKLLESFIP